MKSISSTLNEVIQEGILSCVRLRPISSETDQVIHVVDDKTLIIPKTQEKYKFGIFFPS